MITVDKLTFEYPGQRALDDVSFQVAANSVTALVGPNGAGKTTLMRCLCGLDNPLAGNITVDGIDVVQDVRASHERIGYLCDFFGLYDALSVRQVLRYAAYANGRHNDVEQAVNRRARQLGLSERLDQAVGALSRGLRQRVAIGQALIHDPKVLVLDEPASGLDPKARHDLAELFRSLQAEGMTLLVSSHILSELAEYATDMLLIQDGRITDQQNLNAQQRQTKKLVITLLAPDSKLSGLLSADAQISAIESGPDAQQTRFDFSGDLEAQSALLKRLIAQDIAIASFTDYEQNLQQSYLDSVRTQ